MAQDSDGGRVGNDRDREAVRLHRGHRQADAVDGDGTFFHNITQHRRSGLNRVPDGVAVLPEGGDGPGAVDVTGDDVPAEASARRHSPLQVYRVTWNQHTQAGTVQGLVHHIGGEALLVPACRSEANAVHRHAVPDAETGQDRRCPYGQHR